MRYGHCSTIATASPHALLNERRARQKLAARQKSAIDIHPMFSNITVTSGERLQSKSIFFYSAMPTQQKSSDGLARRT